MQPIDADVQRFIDSIDDPRKRAEVAELTALMQEVAGEPPAMWGSSVVGFGHYHYKYASGREGDWFVLGFAPRKQNLTLYLGYLESLDERDDLLASLGKHSSGKGCLYLKRLSDANPEALRRLLEAAVSAGRAASS